MAVETKRFTTGQFCWAELNAKDPAAAKAFYAAVLGWSATDQPLPNGAVYTTFDVGGKQVAALQQLRPEAVELGMPSHWMSYISVDDVDARTSRARELGATILADSFDMMDAGRMSYVADPTGAIFALWQAKQHEGSELTDGEVGSLCWHDLYTRDMAKAEAFYTALLGYTTESMDLGGAFTLFMTQDPPEENVAGMCSPNPELPSAWQPFFTVADADEAVKLATELGGSITCPPTSMGSRRFAHIKDPEGVPFGVFERSEG